MDGKRFAESIGVAHGTVKRWLYEKMPASRRGTRVWIRSADALAWISKRYPNSIAISRSSLVYLAVRDCDGAIKVGFTSDLIRRLKELRKDNRSSVEILACFPGAKPDELALHDRFAADAIGEEWFRPSDALLAFIAALGKVAA